MKITIKDYNGEYYAVMVDGKPKFGWKVGDDIVSTLEQFGNLLNFTVEYDGELTETEMDNFR